MLNRQNPDAEDAESERLNVMHNEMRHAFTESIQGNDKVEPQCVRYLGNGKKRASTQTANEALDHLFVNPAVLKKFEALMRCDYPEVVAFLNEAVGEYISQNASDVIDQLEAEA